MLSDAALFVAQRLAAALMGLTQTVTRVLAADDAPGAAWTLFHRLSAILLRLGRLDAFGPPPHRSPAAPASTKSPARRATARAALPRRPGWLLDALPDHAPTVAKDLATLLADPAIAELLAADPALQRQLRPILRGLGLAAASAPLPTPPPPATTVPPPTDQPPLNRAARRAEAARRAKRERHYPHRSRRTSILLRYRNEERPAATPKAAAALPPRPAKPAPRSARSRPGP